MTAEDYARPTPSTSPTAGAAASPGAKQAYDCHFVQTGVSFFVSAGDSGLAGRVAVVLPERHLGRRHDPALRRERRLHVRDRLGRRRRRLQRLRDRDARLSRPSPATPRSTATASAPLRMCRSTPTRTPGVSVYDSTALQRQVRLVGRRRNQRVVADVGGPVGRRRRGRELGLRVRLRITFRDITSGNNGASCLVGFDLCSGRGSWTGATP